MTVSGKLPSILNKIWQEPQHARDLVTQLLPSLTDNDILVIIGWDVAATFGPAMGKLSLNYPNQIRTTDSIGTIFLSAEIFKDVHTKETQGVQIIEYADHIARVYVDAQSPYTPPNKVTHSFQNLVLGMQLIRDYLDSTLFLPMDMREREFLQLANSSGIDINHFRQLASWFTSISNYVYNY